MNSKKQRFIKLHGDCYCTQLKVNPSNYKNEGASMKKDWFVWYRFYDPAITVNGTIKAHLVSLRGMNMFKTLKERREATDDLIKVELKNLTVDGFNPITKQYMIENEDQYAGAIDPETPLIEAYHKALTLIHCGHRTRIGIKSVIKGLEKAAIQLRLHDAPVCKVGRKHVKKLLNHAETIHKLTPNRYNAYRGYLNMIYNELVEQEAVSGNPVRDISKKTTTQKIKPVLTPEQREEVKQHLNREFPRFLMFVNLFFHSGGRKTELFQLKPSMVNLDTQRYRCVVKKRKTYVEVERTIKDIALPYWRFFLEDCREDQFIFGKRFKPGEKAMGIDMPSRYWKEYIKAPKEKGGLDIDIDFYALKHLNTSETVSYFENVLPVGEGEKMAAEQNAHTTTGMVVSIYDVKQKDRLHERLKRVNNEF